MMELLHATDTRLGLVTNGTDWMLVDAPKGETTGFITWDATYWVEEPLTLRAFRSLLGVHRFFSVPDAETLEAMLRESASNQQEVTDRLGYQVREAVEVIIRSLDRIDRDENGQLLSGRLRARPLRGRPDGHDAPGLPLLGRGAGPAAPGRPALRRALRRLDPRGPAPGSRRPARRGSPRTPPRRLGPPALHLPGRLRRRPPRAPQAPRPTPGASSTPTASRSSKAASPAPPGPTPRPRRCRSTTAPSSTCSARSSTSKCAARPAASASGLSTSSRSATSTRACSTTPPGGPPSPCSASPPPGATSPRSPSPNWKACSAKAEADLLKFLKDQTGRSESALKKALDHPVEGDASKKLRAVCGRRGPLPPRAALLGPDPHRHLRPSRGHPPRLRLRHRGDRSPLQRHPLHPAQPDRADRPVHPGAPGLRRPGRGHPQGPVAAPIRRGTARPEGLRHGVRLRGVPRPGVPLPVRTAGRGVGRRRAPRHPGHQPDLFRDRQPGHKSLPRITPYGETSEGNLLDEFVSLDTDERAS